MIIGVPKEIKAFECRVLTPDGVLELVKAGYTVLVESSAGVGSGFSDEDYIRVGAKIVDQKTAWERVDLVVKVKEPLTSEYEFLRPDLTLFTFLHLPGNPYLTRTLLDVFDKKTGNGICTVAYEAVVLSDGTRPILDPMSMVAGEMAITDGQHYLKSCYGGNGVLLRDAHVVIIGMGVVGQAALRTACALNAGKVSVFDLKLPCLSPGINRYVEYLSTPENISGVLQDADLVVLAAAGAGKQAPLIITADMFKDIRSGTVLVDVGTDEGGCTPFTKLEHHRNHMNPIEVVDGVLVYCVPNMPGGLARSSTVALTKATLPFILDIANSNCNPYSFSRELQRGVQTYKGYIVHEKLANTLSRVERENPQDFFGAFSMRYHPLSAFSEEIIAST